LLPSSIFFAAVQDERTVHNEELFTTIESDLVTWKWLVASDPTYLN
jgi:hypothetical protein